MFMIINNPLSPVLKITLAENIGSNTKEPKTSIFILNVLFHMSFIIINIQLFLEMPNNKWVNTIQIHIDIKIRHYSYAL